MSQRHRLAQAPWRSAACRVSEPDAIATHETSWPSQCEHDVANHVRAACRCRACLARECKPAPKRPRLETQLFRMSRPQRRPPIKHLGSDDPLRRGSGNGSRSGRGPPGARSRGSPATPSLRGDLISRGFEYAYSGRPSQAAVFQRFPRRQIQDSFRVRGQRRSSQIDRC